MKNKKNVLIGIAIFMVILVAIVWIFIIRKETAKEKSLTDAAKEYFKETLNTEVYVETLVENGYLDSSEKKCILLKQDGENIKEEEGDCKKAEEAAQKPVIVITSTNEFKVGEWNNKETVLKASIKNGGNQNYTEEDITDIKWIVKSEGGILRGDTAKIKEDFIDETYILHIEFKDKELVIEKEVDIKIDNKAPVLKKKSFDSFGPHAVYNDDSEFIKVYYAVSEKNETPQKENMKEKVDLTFKRGKKYYAWSYAVDAAGNETEIDLLGEYESKVDTVVGPTVIISKEQSSED